MEFFTDLLGGITSQAANIVTAIGEAIDRNVTSDEERLKIQLEFKKLESEMLLELHAIDGTIRSIGDALNAYVSRFPQKSHLLEGLSNTLKVLNHET